MHAMCDDAVTLLSKLIRVNSINYGSGKGDERAIAVLVKDILEAEGIEVSEILESAPGRSNIVARLRGDGSLGGALLINAHLDTVPAPLDGKGWKEVPQTTNCNRFCNSFCMQEGWSYHPLSGEVALDMCAVE